jgi:hypothetical protein
VVGWAALARGLHCQPHDARRPGCLQSGLGRIVLEMQLKVLQQPLQHVVGILARAVRVAGLVDDGSCEKSEVEFDRETAHQTRRNRNRT